MLALDGDAGANAHDELAADVGEWVLYRCSVPRSILSAIVEWSYDVMV